jgi:hypothetical protein
LGDLPVKILEDKQTHLNNHFSSEKLLLLEVNGLMPNKLTAAAFQKVK